MAEGLTTKNSLRDSFQVISIYNQIWYQGGILFHGDNEANRIWRFDLELK